MKTSIAIFSALCVMGLAASASAHPGHGSSQQGYLVFWKGAQPKSAAALRALASSSELWRLGFVSKIPILGSQLPPLRP